MIGAGSCGNTDFSVPDCNGVFTTIGGGNSEFRIYVKRDGAKYSAIADYFCSLGLISGQQHGNAQCQTDGSDDTEQPNPVFGFQRKITS